jgi:hypothetical protein
MIEGELYVSSILPHGRIVITLAPAWQAGMKILYAYGQIQKDTTIEFWIRCGEPDKP